MESEAAMCGLLLDFKADPLKECVLRWSEAPNGSEWQLLEESPDGRKSMAWDGRCDMLQ